MIDHDAAREMLELAAVEPGGLDRLAAGDTTDAAVLAGHLAGCRSCSGEAERLRASAALIRDVVIEAPPPELRGRTLDLVRAVGRHPAAAGASQRAVAPADVTVRPATAPRIAAALAGRPVAPRRGFRAVALPLGIAAALILSIAGTAAIVASRNDAAIAAGRETTTELARLASWTLRVGGALDAHRVSLVGAAGSSASGTLLYSPSTTDLVVVAQGLPAAPAGQEYRCWVLLNGSRWDVGQMDVGGGLAYWVGPVAGLGELPSGTPFGVSLAEINGPIAPGSPVLGGSVGG